MAAAKLTKKQIDTKVSEYLKLDEQIKELNKQKNTLKAELESQYSKDVKEKEVIKGTKYFIEKIPVNNGKNNYDASILKPFLKAAKVTLKSVINKVTIEKVDAKSLNGLVKEGKLPESVLDNCRIDKFTFKSSFKAIESARGEEKPAVKTKGTKRKVSQVS